MASRIVSSRLRVVQHSFLTRRGGRVNAVRGAVRVDHNAAYINPYRSDLSTCPRLIDAEVLHGDEQAFWTARRTFYRGGHCPPYYPNWDRLAQAVILLAREVPRVPQEAAFRLFALSLKLMLLPRLVVGTELLLPGWLTMNPQGVLAEALEKQDGAKEKRTSSSDSATTSSPAATATTATKVNGNESAAEMPAASQRDAADAGSSKDSKKK